MNRIKNLFFVVLMPILLSAALTPGVVFAQVSECGMERKSSSRALDELTYKQLNRVYEQVGEKEYDEAYVALQKMLSRAGRDEYLRAILNQALAQVEWSRENFDAALSYFEKAVELDSLPDDTHFALMYQIAQLYFMKDRYQEALDRWELWYCKSPPEKITAEAWVLKAAILARQADYVETLQAIDKAISMSENPKEQWYLLKLASHYELEQYPQAATTLETIISRWPDKKVYWIQLSQIYYKLKQEEKALAIMALAYRRNMLDKHTDITYLSSLYSNAEVPYKAAEVLEKGINDGVVKSTENYWTATADAWYAAEELEKALSAYEKAGKAADDGDIDLRRGYILVDLERWQEALAALNAALTKGGLDERKTGEAYLLRGMAQFNLGNYDGAKSDWRIARRNSRTKDAAQQWINHLEEERRRKAS